MRRMFPALLVACGPSLPPAVEIGAGLQEFRALEEGDTVDIEYGAQGGWHVDLAYRVEGIPIGGTNVSYGARDGGRLSYPTDIRLDPRMVLETDTGFERLGDRVVFEVDDVAEIDGRSVELWVEVDHDGEIWTDARQVVLVGDR